MNFPYRIFLIFIVLLTFLSCKNGKQSLEDVPDWTVFQKFYNETNYQKYLHENINSLSDDELMFSFQVKEFYKKDDSPIWTANGLQKHLTDDFLDLYSRAEEHGLPLEMFGYQTIKDDIARLQKGNIKDEQELYKVLSEVEILLTRANVLYAKTMLYGATDPVEVNGGKWLYETDSIQPEFVARSLEEARKGTTHLKSLQPTDSTYLALQSDMKKYLALRDKSWDTIPFFAADSGQCVKRVHLIGERLLQLGEIAKSYKPSDTLGRVLMTAVNRFRENRAIPRSRQLDEETFRALNKTPQEYINQLAANLERCRWKTKHKKGSDFIAVNIPDFMLEARSADTIALRCKIVCGKYGRKASDESARKNGILPAVKTESPLLYSEVYSIVLNPEWKIPYGIIKDEYYHKMVRNAMGVVNKEKLYIVDNRTHKQVKPESIDWKKVNQKNIPYQLIQSSGTHNALGLYKFNIPTSESVYLHSTNSRWAFGKRQRAYSHGCIRVEKPRELAELILMMNDYDSTRLEEVWITLGEEPTTEEGEEFLEKKLEKEEKYRENLSPEDSIFYRPLRPTNLGMRKRMPVFIEYHTAFIGPNGDVHYRNDVYHKDQNILNAIEKLAPKPKNYAEK